MNTGKMIKRTIGIALALVLALSMLAGCGSDKSASGDKASEGIDYLVLVN